MPRIEITTIAKITRKSGKYHMEKNVVFLELKQAVDLLIVTTVLKG